MLLLLLILFLQCFFFLQKKDCLTKMCHFFFSALQNVYAKKFGDNLTLDLLGSDPVTVSFTGSAETLVCSVTGNDAVCSPEYANRVSVINNSLTLSGLTSSDSGVFSVKEKTGEIISINTVTVEGKFYIKLN